MMGTVHSITRRGRQVVVVVGRVLLLCVGLSGGEWLQFDGRIGIFLVGIFTVTIAALVRRTMHICSL